MPTPKNRYSEPAEIMTQGLAGYNSEKLFARLPIVGAREKFVLKYSLRVLHSSEWV